MITTLDAMYIIKHYNGVPIMRNKKVRVFSTEQVEKYMDWLTENGAKYGTYIAEETDKKNDYDF